MKTNTLKSIIVAAALTVSVSVQAQKVTKADKEDDSNTFAVTCKVAETGKNKTWYTMGGILDKGDVVYLNVGESLNGQTGDWDGAYIVKSEVQNCQWKFIDWNEFTAMRDRGWEAYKAKANQVKYFLASCPLANGKIASIPTTENYSAEYDDTQMPMYVLETAKGPIYLQNPEVKTQDCQFKEIDKRTWKQLSK